MLHSEYFDNELFADMLKTSTSDNGLMKASNRTTSNIHPSAVGAVRWNVFAGM